MSQIINKKIHKSISKDYLTVFAGFIVTLVILASIFIFNSYKSFLDQKSHKLQDTTKLIANSINTQTSHLKNLLFFIGSQIKNNKNYSYNDITNIILNDIFISNPKDKDIFSLDFINWIDHEDNIHSIKDNKLTKQKANLFKHDQDAFEYSKENHWQLRFGSVSTDINSNKKILRLFYGLDEEVGHIGTIYLGLVVDAITKNIEELIDEDIEYYILREDGKLLFKSPRSITIPNLYNILSDNLKKSKDGFINKINIQSNDTSLENILKLDTMPLYIVSGYNSSLIKSQIIKEITKSISGYLAILVMILIIFFIIRRNFINPIRKISFIAENISDGNITEPQEANFKIEELNLLTDKLNDLIIYTEDLKQTKQMLDKANIEISNHAKLLEYKVKERTQEYQKALNVKTEILDNVSHEVKIPVQGITSIAKGLVESWNELTDKEKELYAVNVAKSSERLFTLVTNLLDFSNLTKRGLNIKKEYLDLSKCINSIIEECKLIYLFDKNIKLNFDLDKNANSLTYFDYSKLTQVFRNLLSNAIKYTDEGSINIKLSNQENEIIISVQDSGIGIDQSELKNIFKPFYQAKNTGKNGGTGLGLSISKEIIEAHGGKIWAESDKNGSLFFVSLPVENKQKISRSNKLQKILIVDDEEVARISLELMLSDRNAEINVAYNGEDALNYVKENDVDIILLDLMLPDISGQEVLSSLRDQNLLGDIKVIIQSGKIVEKDIKEIESNKNIRIISKPYDKETINRLIDEITFD